jgi:hypothetical protein
MATETENLDHNSKNYLFRDQIVTREDLQNFRVELLNDLQQKLSQHSPPQTKQWLKSPEVRKLLKISPGTLQNLRINGTLRFTKIGGIIYYSHEDIQLLLESGMNESSSTLQKKRNSTSLLPQEKVAEGRMRQKGSNEAIL